MKCLKPITLINSNCINSLLYKFNYFLYANQNRLKSKQISDFRIIFYLHIVSFKIETDVKRDILSLGRFNTL